MPIQRCNRDGKEGWRYGEEGFCYLGSNAKNKARRQAAAVHMSKYIEMIKKSQDFIHTIEGKSLSGFSSILLQQHHQLYEGYAKEVADQWYANVYKSEHYFYDRVNLEILMEAWLHTLYFEELDGTGDQSQIHTELRSQIENIFTDLTSMIDYIKSVAKFFEGWILLVWCEETKALKVKAVTTANDLSEVSYTPLIAIDTYRHAYSPDYEKDKKDYVENFFKNISWNVVNQRFMKIQEEFKLNSRCVIAKIQEDQQLVFGWANISLTNTGEVPLDWQGDTTSPEVLEAAAYNFVLKYRGTGENHQGSSKGTLIESVIFTREKMKAMGIEEGIVPEGWWVGFYIKDPSVFAKIKSGEYTMFSIEGQARRIPIGGQDIE